MLEIREDPAHPGIYFGVDANEFGTHGAGQIYSINGPAGLPADQMKVAYITDRSTESVTQEGAVPAPAHSGHYRSPLPFANGALVAVHTAETRKDQNTGTVSSPGSRYNFQIKTLKPSGAVWVADQPLTPGFVKTVSYWNPGTLVTYSGPLWELDPVNVAPRAKPVAPAAVLPAPEKAILDEEGIDETALRAYMAQNNIALIVSRNLTTRDIADKQQPLNLHVASSATQTLATAGKIYDISALQIFQADQLRGMTGGTGNLPPLPGRRVVPMPLHDAAVNNPPNPGAPPGAVKINSDGSMAAFVPARRAMSWQLTDPAGAPVVRERYWLTFQPGEIRSCTSCHGLNSIDQAQHPAPQNKPEALRDLVRFWKQSTATAAGFVKLTNAAFTVAENGGLATISAVRFGGSTGAISVQYATSDGTAAAGIKYTATSGTLSWADGDTAAKSFTIPILDNAIVDGDKTLNVTLSAPMGGAQLGTPSAAVLTIVDNDSPPAVAIQITSGPTATPNPTTINSMVQFSCTAAGVAPVTIAWDFGDGSVIPASSNTAPSHAYLISGIYPTTATAFDGNGKSAQGQVLVTVNTAPAPPPPRPPAVPPTLPGSVSKGTLHFNFQTHKDMLSLKGSLPLGSHFSAAGKQAVVTIGAFGMTVNLNGPGTASASLRIGKASKTSNTSDAPVPFSLSFKNLNLFDAFSAFGFSNQTITKPVMLAVPIDIFIDGVNYHASVNFAYTAHAGRTGTGQLK
jgi:hypothetical protein